MPGCVSRAETCCYAKPGIKFHSPDVKVLPPTREPFTAHRSVLARTLFFAPTFSPERLASEPALALAPRPRGGVVCWIVRKSVGVLLRIPSEWLSSAAARMGLSSVVPGEVLVRDTRCNCLWHGLHIGVGLAFPPPLGSGVQAALQRGTSRSRGDKHRAVRLATRHGQS